MWNKTRISILCRAGSPFSGACNETLRHRFRTAADLDLTSLYTPYVHRVFGVPLFMHLIMSGEIFALDGAPRDKKFMTLVFDRLGRREKKPQRGDPVVFDFRSAVYAGNDDDDEDEPKAPLGKPGRRSHPVYLANYVTLGWGGDPYPFQLPGDRDPTDPAAPKRAKKAKRRVALGGARTVQVPSSDGVGAVTTWGLAFLEQQSRRRGHRDGPLHATVVEDLATLRARAADRGPHATHADARRAVNGGGQYTRFAITTIQDLAKSSYDYIEKRCGGAQTACAKAAYARLAADHRTFWAEDAPLLLGASAPSLFERPPPPALFFEGTAVVGHRGAGAMLPSDGALAGGTLHETWYENSRRSVAGAVANAIPWVELDAARTRDGVVVLAHAQEKLHEGCRRVKGHPVIADSTYAELRRVAPAPDRLEDVLREFRGRVRFHIELKQGVDYKEARGCNDFSAARGFGGPCDWQRLPAADDALVLGVVAALEAADVPPRDVVVSSFEGYRLATFRAACPRYRATKLVGAFPRGAKKARRAASYAVRSARRWLATTVSVTPKQAHAHPDRGDGGNAALSFVQQVQAAGLRVEIGLAGDSGDCLHEKAPREDAPRDVEAVAAALREGPDWLCLDRPRLAMRLLREGVGRAVDTAARAAADAARAARRARAAEATAALAKEGAAVTGTPAAGGRGRGWRDCPREEAECYVARFPQEMAEYHAQQHPELSLLNAACFQWRRRGRFDGRKWGCLEKKQK